MYPCEICKIFKNTFFNRTPPVAASEKEVRDTKKNLFEAKFWSDVSKLKIDNSKFFTYAVSRGTISREYINKWPLYRITIISFKLETSTFSHSMQFHGQSLITYSGFWLVSILLQKFDTSSNKEMKMIKTQFWGEKQQQNSKKLYVNIKQHSLLWTRPTNRWSNMIETLEIRRKYK